jgi:hypothetical protein
MELVNDEIGRILNEVIMVYFKVLSQNFPGGTEKNHENCQSGLKIEPGSSQI